MATITVKVIKPKAMNQRAFNDVLLRALADTEKGIHKDFTDTTKTWKHKPDFRHGHTLSTTRGTAYTYTHDEIYSYVNDGTGGKGRGPTYPIPKVPKRKGALRFKWGGKGSYRAKTAPGRFGSRPGGPSGPWVAFKQIQHPGIKPREFDKIIAKRWKTLLPRAMRSALSRAAKASGHGIP
jgi:hypothetical protein